MNYQYNDGQMLLNKEYLRNGSIQDYTGYTYSLDGNRVTSESYQERKEYEYDDLGRLIREISAIDRYVGDYGALETNDTYTYDNRGNRLTKTSNGAVTEYKYDANNRLTEEILPSGSSVAYFYDNNGNTISIVKGIYTTEGTPSMSLTAKPIGISYTYDELNRLTGVTETGKNISYTYGLDNLRRTKTVNGITTGFIWNGSNMVAETNENGIFKIHSYTLDGIAKTTQNDEDRFYLKNGHGDVRWTIYDNGELNRGYYYDAFGNLLWSYQTNQAESSMDDNMFGYAGEYLDEETDLIYLRNRYYNTSNGRFITEDPIKDGLNWYAYCSGNPVMMIDPLGLTYKDVADALNDIILAKSTMNVLEPTSVSYQVALNNALVAKQKIRDSVIYIEDWSYLRPMLSTITEGNDNSIEHIKEVREAVLQAEKDYKFDKFMLDASFYGFFVGGAVAAKAGVGAAAIKSATKAAPIAPTIVTAADYARKAAQQVNNFTVSLKHLANAGGNYAKFATTDTNVVNQWISKALTSATDFVVNSPDSYSTIVNMNNVIGTNGESAIKVVFTTAGNIITAYPVK